MRKKDGTAGEERSPGGRWTRRDSLFWGASLLLFLLSWLSWSFFETQPHWKPLEESIRAWTDGGRDRGVLWFGATILSDLGHGFFLGSLLWVLWVQGMKLDRVQEGVLWLLLAGLACTLLKFLVDRDRPFGAGDHSWPSGHSAAILSVALFLGFGLRRPWAALLLLLALLVGASRVVHLRHYPSDVLGGFGLALFLGPIVRRVPPLLPPVLEEFKPRVVGFGLGLLVFLLGVQRLPSRPELLVGFLGLLLLYSLDGLLRGREL